MQILSAAPILVIDDNELFRRVLGALFEERRFPVKLAASPREALAFLRTAFFSLVITDYVLDPGGDVERLAQALLDAAAPIPVGCLTGWTDIPKGIRSRYAFVLHKPVTAEALLTEVGPLASPRSYDPALAEMARAYFAGLSAASWDDVASLCAADVRFSPPPRDRREPAIQGRDRFRSYMEETLRGFPNATFELHDISFLPSGLIAGYRASWRAASGARADHPGQVLFTFEGARISTIDVRPADPDAAPS